MLNKMIADLNSMYGVFHMIIIYNNREIIEAEHGIISQPRQQALSPSIKKFLQSRKCS